MRGICGGYVRTGLLGGEFGEVFCSVDVALRRRIKSEQQVYRK